MKKNREVEVLLIEDDPGDVELTREGLKKGKICVKLTTVDNGVKAMQFLRREKPYHESVRPDLILLDLNLPKKDGKEVLFEIKSDDDLKSIPVVVLTTSEADMDIIKCYDLGANCYVSKPVRFDDFVRVVHAIEDFWFTVVKIPSKNHVSKKREE